MPSLKDQKDLAKHLIVLVELTLWSLLVECLCKKRMLWSQTNKKSFFHQMPSTAWLMMLAQTSLQAFSSFSPHFMFPPQFAYWSLLFSSVSLPLQPDFSAICTRWHLKVCTYRQSCDLHHTCLIGRPIKSWREMAPVHPMVAAHNT